MAVSDRVKSGPEKAPHRSLWKALGLTDEELDQAVEFAESSPQPDPDHIFDGLYA